MSSALVTYSRMIKLSHTIFALPFALAAGWLSSREVDVTWTQWAWILWCMVMARSSAMGFNRLVDRDIDGANPRTAVREIPSGQIDVRSAWLFTLGSAALFIAGAFALRPITGWLSPVALVVLWGYSYAKRFTALCHAVLGVALGLAPIAVWLSFTGSFSWVSGLLALTVGTWVAGFDIIYSCQDADFDREQGLHSVPATLGVKGALIVSALLHLVTVACLFALPQVTSLSSAYYVGAVAMTGVLAYEHAIVRPTDLSRVNKAFFDLNGYVSILFFGSVWLAS